MQCSCQNGTGLGNIGGMTMCDVTQTQEVLANWATILSIVLSVVSIVLGMVSIVLSIILGRKSFKQGDEAARQAKELNDDTKKALSDIKFMGVQQIKLLNSMEKGLHDWDKSGHKLLNLAKDEIELHKLSTYDDKNAELIMDRINHLSIKGQFKKKIEEFLQGNEKDGRYHFWGKAEGDDEINFEELYATLLEYSILLIINYH